MDFSKLVLVDADVDEHIEYVRTLFVEYATSVGFSLCFQNFDQELANLPGMYSRPDGRLLIARIGNDDAGCVAMRRLSSDVCEMKRLYVRPAMRGHAIGRRLAEAVIDEARHVGYQRMRLDTIEPLMKTAVAMYRKLGFVEIAPYTSNPLDGTLYMELQL